MTETATPAAGPIEVDIVSDVVCPWFIVGFKQLEQAVALTGVDARVRWHPFELNPEMPAEGENLAEHIMKKYGSSAAESEQSRQRIAEIGAGLGFTFAYMSDMRIRNTFRAHQLIRLADARGLGHAAKMALFEAYFTRRENVDDIDVLVAVAEAIGLDGEEARAALEEGRLAGEVREEERFWTSHGIHAVPAMVFQRKYLMSGARGVERYAEALSRLAREPAA